MKCPKARHLFPLLIPMLLGGCQMLGAGAGLIGSILQVALYLAAIAAPILLSYYLYNRHII